ncbi:MAG: ABC transporter ATP-binding protein [Mesorhizobium sp.]|uniref:oligopeptide/dipeptide ABC transporter ATP-binding protein n=2 Tax=Mesorhizobium sp. TaxID=1871066 RepID=UPI000FE4768D|nr:ABC transporter ATP-binding protein [Mesorhizobium sp.]RWK40046.1 MAG: ABC transporter ATP-binding protein [Mesorhizobium sp.]RWK66877.1 MAG: ABC transporter ATP-binding protein [Mesorhizobium sp.]RWK73995.1 MAG: ABC transporter ATP-binding protein [Mesorhizobium sp.]RWK76695.1 MAG: ABC transporter ATP-binding protein [Mesorhizobium sp.]RWL02352.1 MAG: ABC transporter ATP-binding protein [Mesorhizobium sp.]
MAKLSHRMSEPVTESVLTVKDLSVILSREGRPSRVLDGISFDIFPTEIIALVGESGSGKTSIGLTLQGLLPREYLPQIAGSIRLAGIELVGAGRRTWQSARRHLVRAISQDPMGALNPTMTIRRQMRESNGGAEKSIEDWLNRTGLPDPDRIADALPHRLSGGQRQRVLIAMAMMARPKLLIADEPTTALDVTMQAQILDLLRDLARDQQTAILFVTHDLSVAASLADRILVLYAGRIVEMGHIQDVARNAAHPYSAGLLAARFDLDSDRRRPLATLPSERTPSVDVRKACAYATRCPIAQPDCRAIRPPLEPASVHDGAVACLHHEQTPLLSAQRSDGKPWPGQAIQETVALRLSSVGKTYPTGTRSFWGRRQPQPVLRSVNLSIKLGECVALVGESGAGKSTLLRIAAGLVASDSGTVTRFDKLPPQVVFQDPVAALTPWLTIGEQIGERLRAISLDSDYGRRRVGEAIKLVGLDPVLMDALPAEISVGQCQRAVLARAIIVPPKLLLCDEPISAMDVSLAATTLNLLSDLRRRLEMAMLFVTHDLAAARIIADRIAVLKDGELIEIADPDAIIAAPQSAYTRSLIAAMPSLQAGGGR